MLRVLVNANDPVAVIMEGETANNEGDTDGLSIEGLSVEGEGDGDDSSLEGRDDYTNHYMMDNNELRTLRQQLAKSEQTNNISQRHLANAQQHSSQMATQHQEENNERRLRIESQQQASTQANKLLRRQLADAIQHQEETEGLRTELKQQTITQAVKILQMEQLANAQHTSQMQSLKENERLNTELKKSTQHVETLLNKFNAAKAESEALPFYETRVNELFQELKQKDLEVESLKDELTVANTVVSPTPTTVKGKVKKKLQSKKKSQNDGVSSKQNSKDRQQESPPASNTTSEEQSTAKADDETRVSELLEELKWRDLEVERLKEEISELNKNNELKLLNAANEAASEAALPPVNEETRVNKLVEELKRRDLEVECLKEEIGELTELNAANKAASEALPPVNEDTRLNELLEELKRRDLEVASLKEEISELNNNELKLIAANKPESEALPLVNEETRVNELLGELTRRDLEVECLKKEIGELGGYNKEQLDFALLWDDHDDENDTPAGAQGEKTPEQEGIQKLGMSLEMGTEEKKMTPDEDDAVLSEIDVNAPKKESSSTSAKDVSNDINSSSPLSTNTSNDSEEQTPTESVDTIMTIFTDSPDDNADGVFVEEEANSHSVNQEPTPSENDQEESVEEDMYIIGEITMEEPLPTTDTSSSSSVVKEMEDCPPSENDQQENVQEKTKEITEELVPTTDTSSPSSSTKETEDIPPSENDQNERVEENTKEISEELVPTTGTSSPSRGVKETEDRPTSENDRTASTGPSAPGSSCLPCFRVGSPRLAVRRMRTRMQSWASRATG